MSKAPKPVYLNHINKDGSVKARYLFVGNVPSRVASATEKYVNGEAGFDKSTLKQYYGTDYTSLRFDKKLGGDQDPFQDDLVGDIFSILPKAEIQKQQHPPEEESEEEKDVPKKEKREKVMVVTDVTLYEEDRVTDVKNKIYFVTGILPMFQHLFTLVGDDSKPKPASYQVWLDHPVEVDIIQDAAREQKILGFSIDQVLATNRLDVSIVAADTKTQLKDLNSGNSGRRELFLADLELSPLLTSLQALQASDKAQFDLIYWGHVVKFYPMITATVFENLVSDFNGSAEVYPDLFPSQASLKVSLTAERDLLDRMRTASDDRDLKKLQENTSLAVKTATLLVEGRDRIKLDVSNLFDTFATSPEIPIIRLASIVGRRMSVLTKMHIGSGTQKVYDSIRYRLKLPTSNSVLFVIPLSGKPDASSAADTEHSSAATEEQKGYMIVILQANGKYQVKFNWEDESAVDVATLHYFITNHLTVFIQSINDVGRAVFNSPNKLPIPTEYNSHLRDLYIVVQWYKTVSLGEYKSVLDALKLDFKAGIIRTPNLDEAGDITFAMYKGMTPGDATSDYSYLSTAEAKSAWLTDTGAGRAILVSRRTSDVRIDMTDMSEDELEYFYQYITTRLLDISASFKTKPTKQGLLPKVDERGRLKLLKERDPKLYKFKRFGSNIVYSRICQKQHQPELYHPNEYDRLPAAKKKSAIKYWNFTTNQPAYYVCPNPTYPHLSFIVGQHPKNFCLPCCKKTEITYEHDLSVSSGLANPETDAADKPQARGKTTIYNRCMQTHVSDVDESPTPSRYIMTYGKQLDIGRISYLPGLLEKYFLYNLEVETPTEKVVELALEGGASRSYNTETLRRITKSNKTRATPVRDLMQFLEATSLNKGLVVNADLAPLLLFKGSDGVITLVDGLYSLARQISLKAESVQTKYVTWRQMQRAVSADAKAGQDLKMPGHFMYGVPQNTANVANIGCLHAISTALMVMPEDFIARCVEALEGGPVNLFQAILGGSLPTFFVDVADLVQNLKWLVQPYQPGRSDFQNWNELFIDLAKYVFNTYVLVIDDRTIDTSGTSIKETHDDIRLQIPNTELIPAGAAREFVVLLRRYKKTKNVFSTDYNYYPIFVFIPHEFFKTLEIKKRIFTQEDGIIKLIRDLSAATAPTSTMTFSRLDAFVRSNKKYSLQELHVTAKDYCYAATISFGGNDLTVPVAYSGYSGTSLKINRDPLGKLSQSYTAIAAFVKDFNNHEDLQIKVDTYLALGSNVIGFSFNGMHFYFTPVPMSKIATLNSLFSVSDPKVFHLKYDPVKVNAAMTLDATKDRRSELAAKARAVRQAYPNFITEFMNNIDSERDTNLRGKIKKLIILHKIPDKIRTTVRSLLEFDTDKAIFEDLLLAFTESRDRKALLESLDQTIFRFDRLTLEELRQVSDTYGQSSFDQKQSIHKKMVRIISSRCSRTSRAAREDLIDVFATDLVNPLKRDYLLSGIYGKDKELFRFVHNPQELLFIE